MYVEYNIFDHNGKQTLHTVAEKKARLGTGWCIMFKKPMLQLLLKLAELPLKTLFVMMTKQTYEPFVVISTAKIAEILHYTQRTVQRAVAELIEQNVIRKIRVDGVNVFIINPAISLCGTTTLLRKRQIWELICRKDDMQKLIDQEENPAVRARMHEQLSAIESALKQAMDNRDIEAQPNVDIETGEIIDDSERENETCRDETSTQQLQAGSVGSNGDP